MGWLILKLSAKRGFHGTHGTPSTSATVVDQLVDKLAASGLGAYIDGIFCRAPMYADDLALIASSPDELQGMLSIVHSYAKKWQYSINADKSAVMVFGESAKSWPRT